MALLSAALVLFLSSSRTPRKSFRLFASTVTTYNDNQLISSTKSNTAKSFQSLLRKRKARQEQQATVVEGPKMIFDLLRDCKTRQLVQQIFVSTDYWDEYMERLNDCCKSTSGDDDAQSPQILPATPQVVKACSEVITCQGIVAKVSIPQLSLERSVDASSPRQFPLYVICDGLQDPGNLGTLMRTCRAANVAGLIVLPNTCDMWAPKTVRSAMGMSFQLPIVAANSWKECCAMLMERQCQRILAATMLVNDNDAESCSSQSSCYFDIDYLSEPTAIVLGSEGSGLSDEVYQNLLMKSSSAGYQVEAIHIPMAAGVESLNAAVCGSLIIYEYVRQQRTLVEQPSND